MRLPKKINSCAIQRFLLKHQAHLNSQDTLDAPLSLEELEDALLSANTRSVPGPDGIPYSFYMKSCDQSGSLLLKAAEDILTRGFVSPSNSIDT